MFKVKFYSFIRCQILAWAKGFYSSLPANEQRGSFVSSWSLNLANIYERILPITLLIFQAFLITLILGLFVPLQSHAYSNHMHGTLTVVIVNLVAWLPFKLTLQGTSQLFLFHKYENWIYENWIWLTFNLLNLLN